ncbi:2-amino-4-hydroxy-6-hydroxymethyldihydropteridine diphosphokinase [Salinibius halmophilus]|uniref:2-amino-4-hydroxy-6- hydroxymethyldihydropteridine diphosphokinase n=1 Tax=Salinibius halmophilus TaxID=1853216 RepID=UPI000E668C11|nr:2-amino-4-hydroxy-6-hydroxymethyldihydropteridine diphosphokinase [Salinibius halmophilus]
MTSKVYIGLGSNLSEPLMQVKTAVEQIATLPETVLVATSSWYRSKPVGPQDQPDFVNGVAEIDTTLGPMALLDALQELEQKHGRQRLRHWGERTLDLDIIVYGELSTTLPRLLLPHPFAYQRGFVLQPLAELAPELQLSGKSVSSWLAAVDTSDLRQIGA